MKVEFRESVSNDPVAGTDDWPTVPREGELVIIDDGVYTVDDVLWTYARGHLVAENIMQPTRILATVFVHKETKDLEPEGEPS